MLLHHSEQFERHAAGALGAGFPFLDGRGAGVEVAGEDGLADVMRFAELFDLLRLNFSGLNQAAFIKAAHGGFADRADFEQGAGRCVDGFKCIGFEFGWLGRFRNYP